MRIIFMGTPEFAVPCLDMLVKEGYDVAAVITQPDKPKGRGNRLAAPPVKEYALEHGLEVLQPVKVRTKEYALQLRSYKPDLFVTCAYGRILTGEVLGIPPMGCINVHASLLPLYRGAAPIQWAIINGEKETGITTMYTDEGLDTGDMLLKKAIAITDDMTAGELHDKLSVMGAEVLKETLEKLKEGKLERIPQPEGATYAPIIEKDMGRINWSKPALHIHNLVRGTDPWPGAFTTYANGRMRIWKTQVVDGSKEGLEPGTILKVSKEGIFAACGSGVVKITEIQTDSGKRMSVQSYIMGHKIIEGEKFE
ncbi:MAG: methionyl-tRNA formyltransferase [Clostridia bacterium]|nr:methionyl-tRNA formyltransferase [Clostridia bacterium]